MTRESQQSYVAGDHLTKYGAEKLMETIISFWKDRGKEIKIWIEPFADRKVCAFNIFQIRSNLYKGLPR